MSKEMKNLDGNIRKIYKHKCDNEKSEEEDKHCINCIKDKAAIIASVNAKRIKDM